MKHECDWLEVREGSFDVDSLKSRKELRFCGSKSRTEGEWNEVAQNEGRGSGFLTVWGHLKIKGWSKGSRTGQLEFEKVEELYGWIKREGE